MLLEDGKVVFDHFGFVNEKRKKNAILHQFFKKYLKNEHLKRKMIKAKSII